MALAVSLAASMVSTQLAAQESEDLLCSPLQAFVGSVAANETREFVFHTSWGGNFKDSDEHSADVMYAKRCTHGGYGPAKAVCDYLMENGAVEFSGNNAIRAISCLSPKTAFASQLLLERVEVRFSVGTDERGANVTVSFLDDAEVGGMALRVTADGY